MNKCPKCNSNINSNVNFCEHCGLQLKSFNNKSTTIIAILITIVALCIYSFVFWISKSLFKLSYAIYGASDAELLLDFIKNCAISFMFSAAPCIVATVLSYKSKNSLLIFFNSAFLLFNILCLLIEEISVRL